MQKACVVLSLLLMAQTALAGEYNPFLGKAVKQKPNEKAVLAKSTPAVPVSSIPLPPPVPSIPSAQAPYRHMPDGRGNSTGATEIVAGPNTWFSISGRIGDQIVLTDRSGAKSMVQDGSTRNGCFIKFPDIICDKAAITQAKKEFTAESRARAEEDEVVAAQVVKVKELSAALVKAREELRLGTKEAAENKLAASMAKAEVATLKVGIAKEMARVDEIRRELGDAKLANVKLSNLKAALMKEVAEAHADREKLTQLQRKVDEALERGAKAEKELYKLKASIDAPPVWVKGIAKSYKDPSLGEVEMSRAAGQVFFRISREGEDPADQLFGKSIVRKERKGEFTYYALNSHNVRVKEQR